MIQCCVPATQSGLIHDKLSLFRRQAHGCLFKHQT